MLGCGANGLEEIIMVCGTNLCLQIFESTFFHYLFNRNQYSSQLISAVAGNLTCALRISIFSELSYPKKTVIYLEKNYYKNIEI